jgi:hypothetical protein
MAIIRDINRHCQIAGTESAIRAGAFSMARRTLAVACTVAVAAIAAASLAIAAPTPGARPAARPAPAASARRSAPALRPATRPAQPPPDFSGLWARDDPDSRFMPPPSGPGPVTDDPNHPHHGHVDGTNIGATPHIGDLTNPILKPWARAVLANNSKAALAGRDVYTTYAMCRPAGVPLVAVPRLRMQILQPARGRKVTFLYEYDAQVRHAYLTEAHSAKLTPSWYGESIGRYEGDTLIVDTLAQNEKTLVDRFGTPHTGALHVVERYRLVDEGKILENTFTVEDEKTFNMPWTAVVHWKRADADGPFEENICAENPRMEDGRRFLPEAEKPGF